MDFGIEAITSRGAIQTKIVFMVEKLNPAVYQDQRPRGYDQIGSCQNRYAMG